VVAGDNGTICYGKAPGNNLYRAVVGIFGAALGSFLVTLFGAFGIAGGKSSGKAALVIYIFAFIFGIASMTWAYKKFRYGGEVEEGTGIVKEAKKQSVKTSAVKSVAGSFGKIAVFDIASDILGDS